MLKAHHTVITFINTFTFYCYRLSVRAFTQLYNESKELSHPLFSDTYLSLPLRTQAGKLGKHLSTYLSLCFNTKRMCFFFLLEPLGGIVEGISSGLFLIGMVIAITALLIYRQRVRKM